MKRIKWSIFLKTLHGKKTILSDDSFCKEFSTDDEIIDMIKTNTLGKLIFEWEEMQMCENCSNWKPSKQYINNDNKQLNARCDVKNKTTGWKSGYDCQSFSKREVTDE